MDFVAVVRSAKAALASDLHIIAGRPPLVRVHGSLQALPDTTILSGDDISAWFDEITNAKQKEAFKNTLELDFGYTIAGVGRLRCNVARQQGTVSMAIRLLPTSIPVLDSLALPPVCRELILAKRGLIIVSGPTGSGKSTTLAAMIDYLNKTHYRRVITVEDPVEYVYTSDKCTITQRELGDDTLSFAQALKHVLRQDPDVILIGEIRDLETASAVLTLAETGHLVLSTGHAPSTSQAIERIIDIFPPYERNLTQSRLASLLVAVCCQALVPRADGSGRVAAVEVMIANGAVRNLIRDGRTFQLPNTIRTHAREGMQLMDQALVELRLKSLINTETMLMFCHDREEVLKATGEQAGVERGEAREFAAAG